MNRSASSPDAQLIASSCKPTHNTAPTAVHCTKNMNTEYSALNTETETVHAEQNTVHCTAC